MRIVALGFGLLALAGCATAATDAEIQAANGALAQCYVDKAHVLDDRASDALSIGRIVVHACQPELNAVLAARGTRLHGDAFQEYAQMTLANASTDAATAVTLVRRGYR